MYRRINLCRYGWIGVATCITCMIKIKYIQYILNSVQTFNLHFSVYLNADEGSELSTAQKNLLHPKIESSCELPTFCYRCVASKIKPNFPFPPVSMVVVTAYSSKKAFSLS